MTLIDIKNNDFLINQIESLINSGNISHAYIFEGGDEKDREAAAESFAKAVFCRVHVGNGCNTCVQCVKIGRGNHEDVIYVEKDESSVKDEAIVELQSKLKMKPYSGDRRIAIIKDADTMTIRAQNRLLKTLEEPPPGTTIILLADRSESLAGTIQSRCVVLKWKPFSFELPEALLKEVEGLVGMFINESPFYLRKAKIMSLAGSGDEALELLDCMEVIYGRRLRLPNESSRSALAITRIEEARKSLRRGMKAPYVLKSMILKMEGGI